MRAALITEGVDTPRVMEIAEPTLREGHQRIRIIAGSIGPTDLMRAAGTYKTPKRPYVIGGEGVGRLADGRRVYFGHSIEGFGAFAEWTVVADEEIWPIPDDLDDGQAIALGISGTGALIPLEEARIKPGERVLILGATGPLGQVALQAARALGAGGVIAAARGRAALERLAKAGLADDIVQLGTGDDESALRSAAKGGYDVVLDVIYGPPAEAAMRAMADGGRMMSIGVQAGNTVTLSLRDLVRKTHAGVGTGHRPAAERKAAFERLIGYAQAGRCKVEVVGFAMEDAESAWRAQIAGPGGKIVAKTGV